MSDVIHDLLQRPLASLRLSVTDRCNLRCRYCMPEDEYVWLPRTSILTFEEIERLTRVFAGLGVHKVRLTGGEPLLRHDLPAHRRSEGTRLNSSHSQISYAVFCLKKKKQTTRVLVTRLTA